MNEVAVKNLGRRKFLHTAPVAAAAGLALTDASLYSISAAAQAAGGTLTAEKFSADDLANIERGFSTQPGSKNLAVGKTLTVAFTVESEKTAPEFEMHEARDHVFHIVDGTTVIEVGGSLDGKHSIGPGEWLALKCDGAVPYTLNKGDLLVIPRGTPHKRSTAGSVTFLLISSQGV